MLGLEMSVKTLGKKTTILGVSCLVLWAASAMSYLGQFSGDVAATRYPLPNHELQQLGENNNAHLSDLTGQPYLMNFWASWCVTCQAENKFLKELSRQGIPLAGIALKDNPDDAERWLTRFGSPFSVSLQDPTGEYAEKLGVQGAPETFVIDGEGHVRFHYQGLIQPEVWQQRLKPLLEELRVSR